MKTGELIKQRREKQGITQKQLSEALGYDNPQFVSLVENGHSKLPAQMARKFCVALAINKNTMKKALVREYSEKLDQEMGLA